MEFATPTKFFYVYNYTDHLGNVRMSYTEHGPGVPKILEENHYYPFGLKHENYASERFEFIKEPHGMLYVIQPTERREWQYKYQGQERQDELNLNWDSFKWRNYDYAIGRFMCIDPLAEDYAYNSTYAFSENRVTDAVELEGLEKVLINNREKSFTEGLAVGALNRIGDYAAFVATAVTNPTKAMGTVAETIKNTVNFANDPIGSLKAAGHAIGEKASMSSDPYNSMGQSFGAMLTDTVAAEALSLGLVGITSGAGTSSALISESTVSTSVVTETKLIGPAGDAGAIITKQIPSGWKMKTTDNRQGTILPILQILRVTMCEYKEVIQIVRMCFNKHHM